MKRNDAIRILKTNLLTDQEKQILERCVDSFMEGGSVLEGTSVRIMIESVQDQIRKAEGMTDQDKRKRITGKLKELEGKLTREHERINKSASDYWNRSGSRKREFPEKLQRAIDDGDTQEYYHLILFRFRNFINVQGFIPLFDMQSGSMELTRTDKRGQVSIYCSPFWEGCEGIPVELYVEDHETESLDQNSLFMGILPLDVKWNPVEDLIRFLELMDGWITASTLFPS